MGAKSGLPGVGVRQRGTKWRGSRPRHGSRLNHAGPQVMGRAPRGIRRGREVHVVLVPGRGEPVSMKRLAAAASTWGSSPCS
jgi:hypothetical protein